MRIARLFLPHHLQSHPSFLQKSFLLRFFPFYHRHTTVPLSTSVSFNFFQVSSWRAALTSCFRKAPSISSTLLPPPAMFSRLINFWYDLAVCLLEHKLFWMPRWNQSVLIMIIIGLKAKARLKKDRVYVWGEVASVSWRVFRGRHKCPVTSRARHLTVIIFIGQSHIKEVH